MTRNHSMKRPRVVPIRPEGLEPRALLATGSLNSVMELGAVSKAAALEGVEVAAPIAADGSITFAFRAEASGNYLLKVRHAGEGLTIEATGPGGSAAIDPGPAGPFSTIALPLQAGDYRIKASAADDQQVYVDWELLLTTGVGQSAAITSTLAAPPVAVPLPGLSTTIAPSASPSSTPAGPISPASFGPSVAPSLIAASRTIGRSEPNEAITPVGPTVGEGELALAWAGDGLPIGALKSLVEVTGAGEDADSARATSLLAVEALGDDRPILASLEGPSWLGCAAPLPTGSTPSPSPAGSFDAPGDAAAVAATPGDRPELEPEPEASTSSAASPALFASGMILAAVARRWRSGKGLLPGAGRGKPAPAPAPFPPSQPGWVGRPMGKLAGPKSRAWARRLHQHT